MRSLFLLLVLLLPTFALTAQVPPPGGVGIERAFPRLRFQRPVLLTHAGDGSGRVFVVEQGGVVRVFRPDQDVHASEVFLDISDRVCRKFNEEGLLGLAFPPDFGTSGVFYVHYSSAPKDMVSVLSRFRVAKDDPTRADPASEEVILEQEQPWRNHNGGMIAFGPDGYLYVSLGDGGAANDPKNSGQTPSTLLGSILRLDVGRRSDDLAYAIPRDNPFVGREGYRPEIWAYGFRNVWRFSFDRETGELWAGDVGQNRWEEIDLVTKGGNYGWRRHEADTVFLKNTELVGGPHVPPVARYGRQWGISITGGRVYRGARHPGLRGSYFYGDYATGNLWRIRKQDDGTYDNEHVRRTGRSISSFGEDEAGELFLTSFDGGIYRIVPTAEPEAAFGDWAKRLSETGLFEGRTPTDRMVAYQVNAPFWSDGVDKARYLVLPEGKKLGYRQDGPWQVPVGATIVKDFATPGRRGGEFPIETRLIVRTEAGWEAATYVWGRGRRPDAVLRPEGRQLEVPRRGAPMDWHAPSSSECVRCHTDAAGFVLGLTTAQLDVPLADGRSQLRMLAERGLVDLPDEASPHASYRGANDEQRPLAERARIWLDVNCAMCHQPGGTGNAAIDLRFTTALADTGLIDVPPGQGDFGIGDARIVAPGHPERSILLHRVATLGAGRMPNLATNVVDEKGVALLREWILELESR